MRIFAACFSLSRLLLWRRLRLLRTSPTLRSPYTGTNPKPWQDDFNPDLSSAFGKRLAGRATFLRGARYIRGMTRFAQARLAALLLPAALMAGALGSQYLGGLFPCEMCHWQRWPHYAAILLALLAFTVPERPARCAVALAIAAILTSGAIGVFHARRP